MSFSFRTQPNSERISITQYSTIARFAENQEALAMLDLKMTLLIEHFILTGLDNKVMEQIQIARGPMYFHIMFQPDF